MAHVTPRDFARAETHRYLRPKELRLLINRAPCPTLFLSCRAHCPFAFLSPKARRAFECISSRAHCPFKSLSSVNIFWRYPDCQESLPMFASVDPKQCVVQYMCCSLRGINDLVWCTYAWCKPVILSPHLLSYHLLSYHLTILLNHTRRQQSLWSAPAYKYAEYIVSHTLYTSPTTCLWYHSLDGHPRHTMHVTLVSRSSSPDNFTNRMSGKPLLRWYAALTNHLQHLPQAPWCPHGVNTMVASRSRQTKHA